MKRQSRQDWQKLIQQQSEGDLSIVDFCKLQKISTSCFYKHKAMHKLQPSVSISPFIKAKRSIVSSENPIPIKIQHGKICIHLPTTIHSIWLADFIKALA